jgi:hypothetical protein
MLIQTRIHADELTIERPEGLYGMDVQLVVDCEWTLEDASPYCECGGRRCYHTKTESVLEGVELLEFNPTSAWLMPRLPNGELCADTVTIPVDSVVGSVLCEFHAAAVEYATDYPGRTPTERDFERDSFVEPD